MKSLPISVALATVVLSGCAGLGTKSAGRDEAPDTHKQYWAKYDHSLKPVTPAVTLSEKLGLPEPARPTRAHTRPGATRNWARTSSREARRRSSTLNGFMGRVPTLMPCPVACGAAVPTGDARPAGSIRSA